MKQNKCILGILFLISILMMMGCSRQPQPSSFQFSTQKKIQAAHHWEVLVNDLTNDLIKSKQLQEKLTAPLTIMPDDNSSFTRTFRSFLITHFVNLGVKLNDSASNLKLDWSLQLVEHNADRKNQSLPGQHTGLFALSYGVYRVGEHSLAGGLLAGSVALDIAKEVYEFDNIELPASEVIVNVSLLDADNKIIYRKSNIYYINDLDQSHYSFTPDFVDKNRIIATKQYTISD